MMRTIYSCFLFTFFYSASSAQAPVKDVTIARGQMPNLTKDKRYGVHLVFGSGDSIKYMYSKDGNSFTDPVLVAVLPGLFASSMRGPQIAATDNGVIVTACTGSGNIFSYRKAGDGRWTKALQVNDIPEVAKEALMALGADGAGAFALWLGVKRSRGQNLYGAWSRDGGQTWSKNILVYASPDSSVCDCCKPSVVMKGNHIYAMFRNWLNGNRDLYLIRSDDAGKTFGEAKKLGTGSWKLNGCPMDGGGLALNADSAPETVWLREGNIYASNGNGEKELGQGRTCSLESVNGKNVYTWTQHGDVVVMKPQGQLTTVGKGKLPLLKALGNDRVICVWENEKQIHAAVLQL